MWTINVSFWNCCTSPITHYLDLTCSVSSICHECCLSPSHWMWCEMFIIFGKFRETDDWFSSTLLGNVVNVFWNKTTLNNALESNLHVSLRLKSRKKKSDSAPKWVTTSNFDILQWTSLMSTLGNLHPSLSGMYSYTEFHSLSDSYHFQAHNCWRNFSSRETR